MKLLAVTAIWTAGAAAQSLTVGEIMERVAHNQTRSQEARREFTYHQKQLLRMTRGGGKLAREEKREYDVTPAAHGSHKELAHFEGKYESKGQYVSYDRPGYTYKELDIDGELIHEMSEEMTNDRQSRDGLGQDLFPLTEHEQRKYNFQLLRRLFLLRPSHKRLQLSLHVVWQSRSRSQGLDRRQVVRHLALLVL